MTRRTRLLIPPLLILAALTVLPSDVGAQRRAVQASRGRAVGVAVPRHSVPVRYYSPWYGYRWYPRWYSAAWYYPGWYRPYWYGSFWYGPYGYGPYGYDPFWYGQYPPVYRPYYMRYDNTGSARLEIAPRNAQVYVDGYFVGVVDDFDGRLQRLHVPAGEHELQVYLPGYQTFRQKVLFTRGTTLKITHALQPLAPGAAEEPKPAPDPARQRPAPGRSQRTEAPPYRPEAPSEFGTVSLRISPAAAEVLVDGEKWDRPAGEDRFSIDLAEGPHRIEVRKDGFRTYVRTVDVRRGRTLTLNVSLSAGGLETE